MRTSPSANAAWTLWGSKVPYYEEDLPPTTDDSLKTSPTGADFLRAVSAEDVIRGSQIDEYAEQRAFYSVKKLTDMGMRYQHYSELLVIWEDYVAMQTNRKFLGKDELVKVMGLNLAIVQLRKTIANMEGYTACVGEIKALVDGVPSDAKYIYGGRGSALSPRGYEDMG
jgi:hypothetical protein